MLQTISDWFWWDRLWLPNNYTWADLADDDGFVSVKPSQLYISVLYAFIFVIIRHVFERYVATPIAGAMGIKNKVRMKASPNPLLERFFNSACKHPSQLEVYGLAKKCNLTAVQVERWFRKRRNQERPILLKKFQESCWRFTFYLLALIGGVAVLYDKPWSYKIKHVWDGYPKQSVLTSQYWYYVLELSFYWSLLFSVASDVRRKDFKIQLVHHFSTVFLLVFSWCVNYVRVGTLTLLVHDASDFLLEAAKMSNYARWKRSCDVLFLVFALVFTITRLIIFPFWIIYATVVYPLDICTPFFLYYFFNMIMFTLQLLHIYWSCLIFRMMKKVFSGNMSGDDRSDKEEDDLSEEEDEEPCLKNGSGANMCRIVNGQHDR
uniref:Ceramide synthase 3 n=1 Tax=Geotrypetes seraphini TaxID=260995 RepID=A0A6P8PN54_GEOSA|nr:ceramide synthase 3 [Geotrypetes seraphini]XP_033776114.1 ceramide synthase 3 [Geotrypetes seraphini]XP_033776115.1 ceramide synthase 3 [Geotrypetes seraphini]XP_033776116.1 ceramide synthase 3 [Geotrypetes seraphini]